MNRAVAVSHLLLEKGKQGKGSSYTEQPEKGVWRGAATAGRAVAVVAGKVKEEEKLYALRQSASNSLCPCF